MSFAPTVLRKPGEIIRRCHAAPEQRDLVRAGLLWIAVGGAAFGACVGTFRGGTQPAMAAIKIPLATIVSLAVVGPAVSAIARAFGRDYGLRATSALLLSAGARSSLVLLASVPMLWLIIDLGAGYALTRVACVGAYGLAGLSGLALILRALGPAPGRFGAATVSIAVYAVVGMQSAWLLRPYLGDPRDATVPVLAHGRVEGGVPSVLGRDVGVLR